MSRNNDIKKLISVVTPVYNEEENVDDVYRAIKQIRDRHRKYDWEHIFIDNASTDSTLNLLKGLALGDADLKIISNARNYGHIRSPYHGYITARGDAVVVFLGDLQDPPDMIESFIEKWEQGYKVVVGVKSSSEEKGLVGYFRRIFYIMMTWVSEVPQIRNFYGFGLYDKSFMELLRQLDEPYPYFRGLVAEFGFDLVEIPYVHQRREKGITKNNWFTLYDSALLGVVSYSRLPMRLTSLVGGLIGLFSILVGTFYFLYKLIFWESFDLGIAPLVIGIFFLGGVQLLFLGLLGEYVGTILTRVTKRPLVVEKERVNFASDAVESDD